MKKVKSMKVAEDNTPAELREMLMTDLRDFRKGKLTCKQAQTVAKMSDSIMRTMCK